MTIKHFLLYVLATALGIILGNVIMGKWPKFQTTVIENHLYLNEP